MKLVETELVGQGIASALEFDVFICSSGFEQRANFISKTLNVKAKQKFAICFSNYENDGFRKTNDDFFVSTGFELLYDDGDKSDAMLNIIRPLLESEMSDINIGIDYSSMTKTWYSSIINVLNLLDYAKRVNVYFFYAFSTYCAPINSSIRNIHIGPIRGFSELSIPDKPTALIIGLGDEQERAYGLAEYFDAETYVFVAEESRNSSYYNEVKNANKEIFDYVKPEHVFEYSLSHLDNTESLLFSICRSLKEDYRIVLAPTGPKPFTLLSLLVSVRLKNIDVWRISAGKVSKPVAKEADGTWCCYRASFSTDVELIP